MVLASPTMTFKIALNLVLFCQIIFVIFNNDTKFYTKNNILLFNIFSFKLFKFLLFVIDKQLFYHIKIIIFIIYK